jgi:hypothetical protein
MLGARWLDDDTLNISSYSMVARRDGRLPRCRGSIRAATAGSGRRSRRCSSPRSARDLWRATIATG